ncbi:hypothetical protein [Paraburkholderia sp.]
MLESLPRDLRRVGLFAAKEASNVQARRRWRLLASGRRSSGSPSRSP